MGETTPVSVIAEELDDDQTTIMSPTLSVGTFYWAVRADNGNQTSQSPPSSLTGALWLLSMTEIISLFCGLSCCSSIDSTTQQFSQCTSFSHITMEPQ